MEGGALFLLAIVVILAVGIIDSSIKAKKGKLNDEEKYFSPHHKRTRESGCAFPRFSVYFSVVKRTHSLECVLF